MQFDLKAGRTPVVTWACGDMNANVAAGADDQLIIDTANAVKQFGAPMFIRWYWEMNLPAGTNNQDCMGNDGAAGYIAAWRHIHDVFKAQGVTNVSWLWNPAGASTNADSSPYYPGDGYVDWIGFDGYDKVEAHDFGPILNSFYAAFSSHGKPMLIAETGECAAVQSTYLALAQAEIESKNNPGGYAFPLVKGFMYFDAPGHYPPCPWVFGAAGTTAFAAMGADSYFQQKP
ncbi:glycoside hydrolase family 26 protein [Trinickia acidisoli]|uniref:glycoside hydrolase family 26 protein n=1 Tax=Trinickia acidisoli TaxID=2767482 RepID=UPI001A8C531E|nr:glycosyl hydrolase [Trinickia acidisoli]